MLEVKLSGDLVRILREELYGSVVFKHADSLTAGIPDISVTFQGRTTWIETKVARPRVKDREIQRLRLKQLWLAGQNAYYVVYDIHNKWTFIYNPLQYTQFLASGNHSLLMSANPGIDHLSVASFIRGLS